MDEKQCESASDDTRRGAAEFNMDESVAFEYTNYIIIIGRWTVLESYNNNIKTGLPSECGRNSARWGLGPRILLRY